MTKESLSLLALLLFSTAVRSESEIPSLTDLMKEHVIKPMENSLLREMAKDKGPYAKAARERLEQNEKRTECAQGCKPRPIQECLKPNYTIDDEVIGCSKGTVRKYWQ